MSGRPEPTSDARRDGAVPPTTAPATDEPAQPPVHERWWWTGTFRAVLGAVVVGFQWSVMTSGEATALTWVVAAAGAAVALWGLWLVWTAWRALEPDRSA